LNGITGKPGLLVKTTPGRKVPSEIIASTFVEVKSLVKKMFLIGLGYTNLALHCRRRPLRPLLADQVLDFAHERFDILEIPIDGGEPDIGDLVQGL